MKKSDIVRHATWTFLVICIVTACDQGPTVCAGVGADFRAPADTTVALGQSIVLTSGTGGECVPGGPAIPDALTHWQTADPTIASIVVLDSLHARIGGVSPGTTTVTTSTSPTFVPVRTTTLVTVR